MQELAPGVTVITPDIPAEPAFVDVNAGAFPVPDAAKPIAEFVFVQLYVVLVTLPEKTVEGTDAPLQ
jgi:hypothetical protein